MLSIFNYSVEKLSNLESSFSIIDTSWKNKTSIISTNTFRMVIYLSKTFLQTQSFFIVWNEKQMIFVLGRSWSREKKLLIFESSSKTCMENTKAISNYIFSVTHLWSLFIHSFGTNLLASRGTLKFQWICRAQLFSQKTRLHCCLPCNHVTSLLAYCRVQLRINRCTYCIKVLLSSFNSSVKKFSDLESSFSNIDTRWKNKSPIILTEIFTMVINISSKTFLQTQWFFHRLKS